MNSCAGRAKSGVGRRMRWRIALARPAQDTMITRWERGNATPSPYYVERLCQVFGKTASELGLLPEAPVEEPEIFPSVPPAPESELVSDPARFWNVPFRRNPFFTGRTTLLERLRGQLDQTYRAALTQSQALTGLGDRQDADSH